MVCGVFSRDGGLFAALRRSGAARHEVVVWRPADGSIRGRLNLPSNIEVDVEGGSGPCLIFSAEQDVSGISSPLTLLATFRSAAEPEATSALAWRLPAASAQAVAPDTPASPNVRTWSRVAGAGFDADGTRLLLTRSDPRRQAGEPAERRRRQLAGTHRNRAGSPHRPGLRRTEDVSPLAAASRRTPTFPCSRPPLPKCATPSTAASAPSCRWPAGSRPMAAASSARTARWCGCGS
ncbi:MAG: hypothetical protein MZU91_10265 [Desulfosudis oleivorans]|nr:hypothetical protein [Desulfosudis oleivorans]